MARELAPHVGRLSRSGVFSRRALYKGQKKSAPAAPVDTPATVEKTVGGAKNGGKRLVPTSKASRFYPADDVRQPKKSRKSPKPTALRSSITPGTVLILLAGRFRGKRVVFLKQLASGLLLVTGPFKINGVPLRRVNQAYVIATSTKIDLEGFTVDEKLNDAYFAKSATKGAGSAEAEFFEGGKPKAKEAFPESKAADQKAVDKAIIASAKKTENLVKYLGASFGLSKGQFPHELLSLQPFVDGFLDLSLAIPYPASFPPYASTIIVAAVASRLALFSVALWGRNHVRKLENVVLPEVERLKPILSAQIWQEMKREGLPKEMLDPKKIQALHLKRLIQRTKAEQERLVAKYKCYPRLAMFASPVAQLPVFVFMTTLFHRVAQDPTPLDSEAFLMLTTLNHPDPTWSLPILLGVVSMANIEANNWFMSNIQRDRARKAEEYRAKAIAEGRKVGLPLQKILKSGLNAFCVVRIIWAAFSPASVALYWTTSAIGGLVQTWLLDMMSSRPVATPTSTVVPPTPKLPPKKLKTRRYVQIHTWLE
ncbi:60S ribosomal protein L6 [Mycena kentingensis (nom. inval.)]|nr:60S ribosomal protein L6 [Mycena kentingensis (nom. inval.)]